MKYIIFTSLLMILAFSFLKLYGDQITEPVYFHVTADRLDLNALNSYPQNITKIYYTNSFKLFGFLKLSPEYSIEIKVDHCLNDIDYGKVKKEDGTTLLKYLLPTDLIDYNDNEIKLLSDKLNLTGANEMALAHKILRYISTNIKYDQELANEIWSGNIDTQKASTTIKRMKGTCSEYANVFIALMRYHHIPCKYITGRVYHGCYHAWAEFYLKNVGWIPVETQMGAIGVGKDHIKLFESTDFAEVGVKLQQINMNSELVLK